MKEQEYKTESAVPSWLLLELAKNGVTVDNTQADRSLFATADMDAKGDLRRVYVVADDRWLIVAVSATKTVTGFSGSQGVEIADNRLEIVEKIALSRVSCPRVENQVVGGMLTVKIDGTERWLCRFSGSRMQDMYAFVGALARKTAAPKEESVPMGREALGVGAMPPQGGPRAGGFPPGGPPAGAPPGMPPRGGGKLRDRCPQCGRLYPERGRQICPHCMEKKTILMRLLRYFAPHTGRLVLLLACIALSAVLNAVWPYLNGTVLYDQVLNKQDSLFTKWGVGGDNFAVVLLMLVLTMAVTKLLQQITGVIHGRITAHIVPSVVSEIKSTVFASLQRLSISFFTRAQTGSLMQRVNNDANHIMFFFVDGAPYLLFNLATMIFAVAVMFWMDWRLALVAVCLLPPVFFVTSRVRPRLWHAHGRQARAHRSLHSALNDNLTGARVVRAFGQEENEFVRFERVNSRVKDAEMNLVRYRNRFTILYGIARDIPSLLVWSFGALMLVYFSNGRFTYGMLLSFVGYLSMLQGPMDFFSNVFQWWSESMNAAQRVFEIIDAQPDVVEKADAKDVSLYGDIEVCHVDFGYEPNKPVLHDISFSVKRGEMLGIVGRSGAGKSTLVNLISRLYDPDNGEILIDGHDIRDLSFASLRGSVAMVSQETYIFIGTIAENIAYAKPDATREEIIRAAVASSAHGFISKLPDGYDTVIGSGGRQLSGGERQRLSIARAILADPKILVLDEATASVDTETERAIEEALNKLIKNRTTISIAHRLSTLRGADRLVVLSNGRIVESGTHRELVDQRGEYFKLLQLQSKALAMRGVNE